MDWSGFLVFNSCLDSCSDGTHSLQSIHYWASDVMLNFWKSVPTKKQTHLGWTEVDFLFLTAVWTLVLTAPIHCRASITEQTHLGWTDGEYIFSNFHFWVNYSFNSTRTIQKRTSKSCLHEDIFNDWAISPSVKCGYYCELNRNMIYWWRNGKRWLMTHFDDLTHAQFGQQPPSVVCDHSIHPLHVRQQQLVWMQEQISFTTCHLLTLLFQIRQFDLTVLSL